MLQLDTGNRLDVTWGEEQHLVAQGFLGNEAPMPTGR